ncbi:MAG TPA: serine/threonine-protein kinase, partial [Bryobacteraceae bacterium]|nr:serine/threonine-protein kinase [Bryobacteraceae bacterium]
MRTVDRKQDVTSLETVADVSASTPATPASGNLDRPSSTGTPSKVSSHITAEEGRFVPGTLLAGRYRIIGLLGKGGMGEVYRATDLTLGQSVALKFLPHEAAANQALLERFHGEVRVARQVSHPNVCRVYDIGEVEGIPFISMEYIDGEDLASLLQRIGRLPGDKAMETARKICAGLAAAHDRGVIHRDLKPQNIMMNRRGEVVIMDFGLAAIADQLSGAEVRNGTPAYMAPEQLKGSEVSARSDIYSLGLVLYEIFTGRRPFEAKNLQELISNQEAMEIASITSVALDIDPSVDRIIRRCLNPDPAQRPQSALAVAAALPGGDPLAAALAAGETPSPELVAASGQAEGLLPRLAAPLFLVVVFSVGYALYNMSASASITRANLDYPPAALAIKSRELASQFGYTRRPADSVNDIRHRSDLISYLTNRPKPREWSQWLASESPISQWYRESLRDIVGKPFGYVESTIPPMLDEGDLQVEMDGAGKLLSFEAVPYNQPSNASPVQTEAVFQALRLDPSSFTEQQPTLVPKHASDQVKSWKGPHPAIKDAEVTVQAAWWKNQLTQVRLTTPWTPKPEDKQGPNWPSLGSKAFLGFGILMAALLARRNWRKGRIDKSGALKVAAANLIFSGTMWIGRVHAVPSESLVGLLVNSFGEWLFGAAFLWMMYLALEPAVRARWPHSLVTWNRTLAGRWSDPEVNAHILIGATAGCLIYAFASVAETIYQSNENPVPAGNLFAAMGPSQWLAVVSSLLQSALIVGLIGFLSLFGARQLLKKDWLAAVLAAVLFTIMNPQVWATQNLAMVVCIYLVVHTVLIFVLLRFGLLCTMAAVFFLNGFGSIVVGLDWKTWYAPYGLAMAALLVTIAT